MDPTTTQSPLGFREVYNIWKDAQSVPFFKGVSMPEFSRQMVQMGDQDFAPGMEDSRIKRASSAIDRFLGPVSNLTKKAGGAVGGLIGPKAEQYGQDIGEGLPRGLVDLGATALGTGLMMAPEPTMLSKVGGAGLIALGSGSAAAGTYTATDSPGLAAISGIVNAVTPGAAALGEKMAAKAMVKTPLYRVMDNGARLPASPSSKVAGMTERFAEYLGANTAAGAVQEAGIQASSLVADGTTRGFDEPHLVELFGGQLPFALIDAAKVIRGPASGINRSLTSRTAASNWTEKELSKTMNKDRKLLPPPSARIADFPEMVGPIIPPDQFVEINNFSTTANYLDQIAKGERWVSRSGQKSVSPGRLARELGLKTPEETMAVFGALQQRGVIGEKRADGRHAITAKAPDEQSIISEQLRYHFPKVWERTQKDAEIEKKVDAAMIVVNQRLEAAKSGTTVAPVKEAGKNRVIDGNTYRQQLDSVFKGSMTDADLKWLQPEIKKALASGQKVTHIASGTKANIVDVQNGMLIDDKGQKWGTMNLASSKTPEQGSIVFEAGAKPVAELTASAKGKVGTQFVFPTEDFNKLLGDNPDLDIGEGWARFKSKHANADYMEFKSQWKKAKNQGVKLNLSETSPQKPFVFDQKTAGDFRTDEQQFVSQLRSAGKDQVEAGGKDFQDLILHPYELLKMKSQISDELKRLMKVVYTPSEGNNGGLPFEVAKSITEFDIDTFIKGLEERGHSAPEIVLMAANKMQLNLSELGLKLSQMHDQPKVRDPKAVKEYAEVSDNINRLSEIEQKFDKEFIDHQKAYEEKVSEVARRRQLAESADPEYAAAKNAYEAQLKVVNDSTVLGETDPKARFQLKELEENFRKVKASKDLAVLPERPMTPWDVIAQKREQIDRYESRLGVSDTEMLGPGDYVYSEAVRFYDNKEANVKKYADARPEIVKDKTPGQVELMALAEFLNDAPIRKATRVMDKIRRRQVSLERGESWDEGAYDAKVAQDRVEAKASAVREQSDTDFVENDPVNAAEEQQTRQVVMSALPETFTYQNVRALRKGLGKTTDLGLQDWQKRFTTALQMFKDGVLELRRTNKVNQVAKGQVSATGLRVRPESGIRFSDLAGLLGFKDDASTLKWLNGEFMPAMKFVAEQGRRDLDAGKDPKAFWAAPKLNLSDTATGSMAKPFSYLESSERFFNSYFRSRGYSPEKIAQLTSVSVKVAAAFKEGNRAVVAELVNSVTPDRVTAGAALNRRTLGQPDVVALSRPEAIGIQTEAGRNWYLFHTLGHEFAHISEENASYKAAMDFVEQMPAGDRATTLAGMFNLTLPKEVRDQVLLDVINQRIRLASENSKEFLADLTAIFTTGLASPSKTDFSKVLEHGKLMPDVLQDFQNGLYPDLLNSFEAVQAWLTPLLSKPEKLGQAVERLREALNTKQEVDRIRNQWQHLKQVTSPDFMQFIVDPPAAPINRADFDQDPISWSVTSKLRKAMGMEGLPEAEKYLGATPGFLERVFMPIRQLAQKYPQLRPVADLGYEYLSIARKAQTKILSPFLTTGVLGQSNLDLAGTGVKKVLGSKAATEAFNAIALVKNERGQADVNFTSFSDVEMRKLMPKVDKDLQDSVIQMHRAMEKAAPEAAKVLINGRYDELSLFSAKAMLKSNPTVGWEQARKDGQIMVESLRAGLPMPPDLMARYPTGATVALDVLTGGGEKSLFAKTQMLEKQLGGRPWWTPEVRLGRFMVAWKEGAAGFDTKAEAMAFAKEKETKGTKVRVWDKSVRNQDTQGMHPVLIEHFQQIEQAGYEASMRAYSAGDTELFETLRQAYRPGENTWKEFLGKGFSASMLPRKLREGRDTVDVFRGFLQYVSGVTNGVARNNVKHTFALMESDPILRSNPALRQLGKDYIQTVIFPPTREWSLLKKVNFLWFMGGNISSMLLEYSQPIISVMPHFIQQTNDMGGSFKALTKAAKDIMSTNLKKKGLSAVEEAQMRKAADEGVLDFGVISDFYEQEDMAVGNLQKLTSGEESWMTKPAELGKKGLYLYAHAMRALYSKSSRWNNQLTFLTAYRLAMDGKVPNIKKGDVDAAYGYAKTTTPTATYTGGPAARPVGMFANSGKFFGAVGAMYSLQSYSFAAISNVARLMSDSIDSQKLSPTERTAARKALGTMLLGQVSLAGAMGLPLAGGIVGLIEQMFQVSVKDDLEKGADAVAGLFTDDEDLQELFSDVAMRGVASRVFGTDIAARTSLGNVLGVDPYNGFSLDTLIGPTGGVFRNLLNAGRSAMDGDTVEALKLGLPRAYAGVVDFAKDGTEVRDAQGRLIMHATPVEQSMMVLGFKPKRLGDYQQATSIMRKTEEVAAREHSSIIERAAKVLMAGRPQEARAVVMEYAKTKNLNPRALAQRVAEVAQELTIPYNPLDDGSLANSETRSAVAQSFQGAMPPRVSETKKLQQRQSLEVQMGIPGAGRPDRRAMTRAMMVDRVLQMAPTMTRAQAGLMVDAQLSPRRQTL